MKDFLKRWAIKLGFLEEHESFGSVETFKSDRLVVPAGRCFEGELHTDLPVIVAGEFRGAINIRGDGKLIFLKGAKGRGFFSANEVQVNTSLNDVVIDTNVLKVAETGAIEGDSEVRYDQIVKHLDAPINGRFGRRSTSRDGFANLVRVSAPSKVLK